MPSEKLAQQHGINGVPLLSVLDSLVLPLSTGYKFMHLVFEKIVPNLTLLWSGSFKNFDRAQPFVFDKTVWDAIGAAAGVSRVTMPSSYGARVPNIVINRLCFSAETWFQWVLFVGPVVLDGQFSKKKYYIHFCKLVGLINLCLRYELSRDDIIRKSSITYSLFRHLLDFTVVTYCT